MRFTLKHKNGTFDGAVTSKIEIKHPPRRWQVCRGRALEMRVHTEGVQRPGKVTGSIWFYRRVFFPSIYRNNEAPSRQTEILGKFERKKTKIISFARQLLRVYLKRNLPEHAVSEKTVLIDLLAADHFL